MSIGDGVTVTTVTDVTETGEALSGAERQRRYRERKKREAAGSGVQADGRFVPEFPGQREPFAPGNTVAVRHGAYSDRIAGQLGERIVADLLADESTAAYLRGPEWRHTLTAWGRAEAECVLLRAWQDSQPVEDWLTEVTSLDETENRPAMGQLTRRADGRRRESSSAALHRAESRAAALRRELGLTPLSRARLGKDITRAAQFDMALVMADLDGEERGQQAG